VNPAPPVASPLSPRLQLGVGVTGHRESEPGFAANRAQIIAAIEGIFEAIDAAVAAEVPPPGGASVAPTRFHSLLADGTDQVAAAAARSRGWDIVTPVPFGLDLDVAINALPADPADARALLSGAEAGDASVQARARSIREFAEGARLFELAERDDEIAAYWLAMLDSPGEVQAAQAFFARSSERVALAARVMIEQSDIVVGVWNGATSAPVGGTGHTIVTALEFGAPVIWIDVHRPWDWRILRAPESLASPALAPMGDAGEIARLVRAALRPAGGERQAGEYHSGIAALQSEQWRARSNRWWNAYRRVEALFGGDGSPFRSLQQRYEAPDQIGSGSGSGLLAAARALPGGDPDFASKLEAQILRRFAWADGVSAYLSDSYRGGMIANFLLSAAAIVTGILYQPLAGSDSKWMFAAVEFLLLSAILLITWLGRRWRWHGRWFETRRVAEYLRHAPALLLLGVARPPGRWPKGAQTSWPEWYARHGLRELGLPRIAVTPAYLRHVLENLLDAHVLRQRDYHLAKAERLTNVHRNLDALSSRLFQLAVVSVSTFLALTAGAAIGRVSAEWLHGASKMFTFLGVFFPTFAAAFAGIRYFGDFERFAAISQVTAEKLQGVHARIALLLAGPDEAIDYARTSELAHSVDDIVIAEIENWQAVFGGKHITLPA